MKAEMKHYMEDNPEGHEHSRNGFYRRNLYTKYGNIKEMVVPRTVTMSSTRKCLIRTSGGMDG